MVKMLTSKIRFFGRLYKTDCPGIIWHFHACGWRTS